MGRRKGSHRQLPQRMRLSHGAFYWVGYVGEKQTWRRIGATFGEAIVEYAKIEAGRSKREDIAALSVKFQAVRFPELAQATRKNYSIWLRQLGAVFGHVLPSDITVQDARRYLTEHPKRSAARHQVALLSTLLTFAVEIGWIATNPLVGMRKGKREKRERYITDSELAAVLGAQGLRPEHVLACRMAYVTALRIGDVLRLRWSDERDDGLHAAVQKTRSRLVFDWEFDPELRRIVKEARSKSLLGMTIFSTAGRPINQNALYKAFKRSAEVAGVQNVTLHDLRRKRLTDLERRYGMDFARRVAAHTDVRTTAGYVAKEERIARPG